MVPRIRATTEHAVKYMVSPAYRRWRHLLDGLTLDIEGVRRGPAGPLPPDFLVCGPPRSGTALATASLFQPPRVVTVMEPWDALRMPPSELVASLRSELLSRGSLSRGRLDVAALEDGKVKWCRDGEKPVPVAASDSTLLGVKLPGFWRLLDLLRETRFVVCVRDPSEILESFAGTEGRLREGLEYDCAFYADLNDQLLRATSDVAERRALLLEESLSAIGSAIDRPNVHVIRYEHWFDDPEAVVGRLGEFLKVELEPARVQIRPPKYRNANVETKTLIADLVPSAAKVGY